MKCFIRVLQIVVVYVIIFSAVNAAKGVTLNYISSKALINTIQGQVFDPYRVPISDIYVELRNDLGSTISRARTTTGGRFLFSNISTGHFEITVLTIGTNFLEQTQSVDIVNIFSGTSDSAYVDFYLQFDKRKTNIGEKNITEAIFVQDVPEEARKLYKSGVKSLGSKDDSEKGFNEIEQAIKVFPDYFEALITLGREYVKRKEYTKAVPYLIKCIDINQRSFSSYYLLAYAAYKLNSLPEAIKAAQAATVLQPTSFNAQLLYGQLLRLNGNYEKALEILLKAENLAKDTPSGDVHWQLALVYNRLGRNKEAADELEAYLKAEPSVPNKKEIEDLIAKLRSGITTTIK